MEKNNVDGPKMKTRLSVIIIYIIAGLTTISFLSFPIYSLFPEQISGIASGFFRSNVKQQDKTAMIFINSLKNADYKAASGLLEKSSRPKTNEPLEKITRDFQSLGKETAMNLADAEYSYLDKKTDLVYWADHEKGSIKILVTLVEQDKILFIDGFKYVQASGRYSDLFRLPSPLKISFLHYLAAALAVFLLYFTFSTLIKCAKSDVKLKWLWIIFISIGIGCIGIVWKESRGSARLRFLPYEVQLFSVGIVKMPITDPALLKLSFPLGAIIFRIITRKKKTK